MMYNKICMRAKITGLFFRKFNDWGKLPMNNTGKIRALLAAAAMVGSLAGGTLAQNLPAAANYGPGTENVEYLNRGISAVNTGRGMLVSWRWNANDADDAIFKLYRDDTLIYTSEAGKATCFLDEQGSAMKAMSAPLSLRS